MKKDRATSKGRNTSKGKGTSKSRSKSKGKSNSKDNERLILTDNEIDDLVKDIELKRPGTAYNLWWKSKYEENKAKYTGTPQEIVAQLNQDIKEPKEFSISEFSPS